MEYYYEILAFHILSILSWMSMLFYLPRLFVYHIENKDTKEFTDIIKVQEYKLYKYIGIPAMWASLISGSVLIYLKQDLLSQDWMELKLITLFFMIIFSLSLDKYRKQLKNNICFKSSKFFRMYNEIPTLLSILIVVLVITKNISIPFNLVVIFVLIFMIFLLFKESLKNKLKK
jgi:putative membrane protein